MCWMCAIINAASYGTMKYSYFSRNVVLPLFASWYCCFLYIVNVDMYVDCSCCDELIYQALESMGVYA